MRKLEKDSLKNWNEIDWQRSAKKLSVMVSKQTGLTHSFHVQSAPDGTMSFPVTTVGHPDPRPQPQVESEAQRIFDSLEWIVYRN